MPRSNQGGGPWGTDCLHQFFRSSTLGERARLLTENEAGSNPAAGAITRSSSKAGHQPLKLGNAGSNPVGRSKHMRA